MAGNNNHLYRERPRPVWEDDGMPDVRPSVPSLRALRATAKKPFAQMAEGRLPEGAGNEIMSYLSGKLPLGPRINDPTAHMEELPHIQSKAVYQARVNQLKRERQAQVTADPQGALSGDYGYEVQQEAIRMGIREPEPPPMNEEEMMVLLFGPNWREKKAAKKAKKAAKKAAKAAAKGNGAARKSRRNRKSRRKNRKTRRN